jgi:hypothetical protein
MLNNDSRTKSLVGRVLADARGPSILWPRLCPAIIRIWQVSVVEKNSTPFPLARL